MNKNSNVRIVDADKTQPTTPAAKKKILYIVEAMGGGVFTYIVDLSNELVNSFDMYIAYAVRPQTPENYREYFDKRIHLIEVKNFGRAIDISRDFKAFAEIRAIAKKVNPDVIHLHSSKAGALGRVALNGRKTPMFYTPHGYSFLMENYKPMKRRIFRLVEGFCARFSCTTISCSEGEHKETLKLTKRALYVDNGVNVKELQALIDKADVSGEHSFTVFTLGRINYQKNPELFNRIAEAMPDVRFLWIGDGELRDYLKSENIEITGWVERNKALKYSLPADVFLLTSSWEGLPISLLEAMFMKKPCIVSNVIGNRDVIHDGENGFVCNDVVDYVAAIKRCQTEACDGESTEVQSMVEHAYTDILNEYNTKAMAEKYSRIYLKALGSSKSGVGGVLYEVIFALEFDNIIYSPVFEQCAFAHDSFTQTACGKAVA